MVERLPKITMEYTLLKDINPDSHRWCVKTRAVRFNEYVPNEQSAVVHRLDIVLVDEKGKCMEAQIPQRVLDTYRPLLHEDQIYYIKYFEVACARSSHRPVDHPYMARFTKHTRVTPVATQPPEFPLYGCTLSSFEELKGKMGNNEVLLGVIGLMESFSPITTVSTRYGARSLRKLCITNGRQSASIALWSRQATLFEAELCMQRAQQRPVALLICGVTAGWYDSRLSLQGSPLCKWYIDPVMPEVRELMHRYADMVAQPGWVGQQPVQAPAGGTTIADLVLSVNPHEAYGNRYNVTAKVKSVRANQN